MKKVQVLLSTFNGQKYLPSQLDSLLNQDYPDLEILIRDDGSTDGTPQILMEIADRSVIKIIWGDNVGITESYFELLKNAADDADFFAFCDQDDVWHPHKISRAVEYLNRFNSFEPCLYFSRAELVGENLKFLNYSRVPVRDLSLANAMVENFAAGCTMLINRAARDLIKDKIPSFTIMYDWWIYLTVIAFGHVIYDQTSHIMYRQHKNNAVGMKSNCSQRWYRRLMRYLFHGNLNFIKQAEEFYRVYHSELDDERNRLLLDFIANQTGNFGKRLKYLFHGKVYRQYFMDNLLLKLLILTRQI